jgi:hypothetical protein
MEAFVGLTATAIMLACFVAFVVLPWMRDHEHR